MTLDVESRVTRGSSLEAEEGRDAGDAVESRHLGGVYVDKLALYVNLVGITQTYLVEESHRT